MTSAGLRLKRRAPSLTRSTSVSMAPPRAVGSGPGGEVGEDLGGSLAQRRIVTEHNRLDVDVGQAFHAPSRLTGVVAIQLARVGHPPEPRLEVVAHDEQ